MGTPPNLKNRIMSENNLDLTDQDRSYYAVLVTTCVAAHRPLFLKTSILSHIQIIDQSIITSIPVP